MKRKIIILLLLPFLQVLLYSACCREVESYFIDITQIQLDVINSQGGAAADSAVTADTLALGLTTTLNYVSSASDWSNFSLIHSACATSCDIELKGLKDSVRDVNVYARESYFTLGAQKENLRAIVSYQPYFNSGGKKDTEQEYLAYLNQRWNGAPLGFDGIIFITQKSTVSHKHTFMIEMITADGDTLLAQTKQIEWR